MAGSHGSGGRGWLVAAAGVLAALVGVAVLLALKLPGWLAGPHDIEETAGARQEGMSEAFAGTSSTASPALDPLNEEIDRFFTQLGADYRSGNGERITHHFDYLAMLRLADKRKLLPPTNELELRSYAQRMRESQRTQVEQTAKYSAWERHRVVKITVLDPKERDEVLVYVRQISKTTGIGKSRWWLLRDGDRWVIYDNEELSLGLRMSTMLGAGLSAAHDAQTWGGHFAGLMVALQAMADGRVDELATALDELRAVEFPPQLKALVVLIDAGYQIAKGDFGAAVKLCERVRELNPEMLNAFYVQTTALNLKEDYAAALATSAKYVDALGSDADIALEQAIAYRGLGKLVEASNEVASCLDEVPDETGCLRIFAAVATPEQQADLDARFRKLEVFDATLATVLDESLELQDAEAAAAVLDAIERVAPKSPLLAKYRARVDALAP